MAVDGSLNFDTQIDSKGFDKGIKNIDNSVDALKGQLKDFAKVAVAAFSTKQLVSFGKSAVEAAASVNASNAALTQTFKGFESAALDAMGRVADASGILRTRLQGVGTQIYAFAKTSGMDSVQALSTMEEALQVAADSAAYYDRSLEDTSASLMSFLKGNYANDAALGLSATEYTRNAAAMKLYGKSFKDLSEAQKQVTLLQMVKDANALSGAEGQAAREADGWENVIGNLKEAWRQLLAVIGQPILKTVTGWVIELTEALTFLTQKAQIAFNTLAKVFGQEADTAADTTQSITQSVTAQQDLTEAVEETEEAQKSNLAGFDKMNIIASKTADKNKKSGAGNAAAGTITPSVKVKDNTKETSKKLEKFLKETKKGFEGLEKYITKNFGPSFKKVWGELSPQVSRFGSNMGQVFSDIKSLGPPLLEYLNGDFTTFLQTFIETSGHIIAGLFDSFNTCFSDIWNVAVFPILKNFVTTGLPLITQFATEVTKTLGALFDEQKKNFDTLWKVVAVPSLKGIATVWTDTMNILKEKWDEYGAVIFGKFREAIQTTGNVFRNVFNTIFAPVFDSLFKALDNLWEDHAKPLLDNFIDFAAELGILALDIYNNFIGRVVNWFVDTFGPSIANALSTVATNAVEHIGDIFDVFNNLFTLLKDVLNFVKDVFKGDWEQAWEDIQIAFSDFWNLIESIVKVPLNAVVGLINAFITGIESAFNAVISALNTISVDIPDWVPVVGGETFGIDLDKVDFKEIPKLAQGTVIPANYGNFLAMLGDNKRETEVVSPLSTIEQAVRNAMAGTNKEQTIHVHVMLDGREIGRVAVKAVDDNNRRKGA